jgi:hypothetical protein
LLGLRNPRRRVDAEDCPGGQLVGHPRDGTRQSPCDWHAEVGGIGLSRRDAAGRGTGS